MMNAIGLLMKEHRTIEKVIDILKLELQQQQETNTPNTGIILTTIDFFQTYADITHHGKEEDILFEQLKHKEISKEHREKLDQLLNEHQQARFLVNKLHQFIEIYRTGDQDVVQQLSNTIQQLVILYTNHIKTEDEDYFKPIMDTYFTEQEKENLIEDFHVFDQTMIHRKYNQVVKHLQTL